MNTAVIPPALARRRNYAGPALFSYGFRPFFLSGAAWAAVLARIAAAWIGSMDLLFVAAFAWIAAFALFVAVFGPLLCRARV